MLGEIKTTNKNKDCKFLIGKRGRNLYKRIKRVFRKRKRRMKDEEETLS